ncbi:MAG: pyridoxal phosphate-dependent aminotransferase [Chlamydiae bacterium]|nr:pyridoxal phosphate-dependent aminotransferase [Chlamydiota bacterium]MBI3277407.1 pyridoxal phosphate-dependent aminotransferase [Chlamydiota bacterium]
MNTLLKTHTVLAKRVMAISESETLAINARSGELKAQGVDVVSFAAGEPDFDTPDHIKEFAKKAIDEGFTKYTPSGGTLELKKAICEKFKKDQNLDYAPENVIVSCGAKHSLFNAILSLCDKDDEVIIPVPYWVTYPELVRLANATPVFLRTREEEGFKINPVNLKKVVSRKTKVIIMNSPSNPTGSAYTQDELKEIAKIVFSGGVYVISDEIYSELLYDEMKHTSLANFNKDQTLVVNGVSKSYSMTGWRIGYLAGPSQIVSAMNRLQSHSTSNPTSISQKAAVAALKGTDECVKKMAKAFQERRDTIVDRLNQIPKVHVRKPEGAFYVFPNVARYGIGSAKLSQRLLEEAHVAVVPGAPFGADDYIRLSYATSMENIKKGVDRIESFFRKFF